MPFEFVTDLRRVITLGIVLSLPSAAIGQNIDFRVDNITLEQTVATNQMIANSAVVPRNMTPDLGSTTVILQQGDRNSAHTGIFNSNGGAVATLQVGDQNKTVAAIVDSPGSAIAQVQIGNNNSSIIGIVGGSDNIAATAQVGSNNHARIGLENSTGTTVTFGQAGGNHNGGIVIKNAPRGTRIRID